MEARAKIYVCFLLLVIFFLTQILIARQTQSKSRRPTPPKPPAPSSPAGPRSGPPQPAGPAAPLGSEGSRGDLWTALGALGAPVGRGGDPRRIVGFFLGLGTRGAKWRFSAS